MPNSQTDFKLPGLSQGIESFNSLIVAIAFGYSGRWNARRLENHFHAFWNLVLTALVNDLAPCVLVIPQFQLDTFNISPFTGDDSIQTFSQLDGNKLTPDFSVALFRAVQRRIANQVTTRPLFPTEFNLWRQTRILTMKLPCIVELKRPATRAAQSREAFASELDSLMGLAQVNLDKQAELAFEWQLNMEKVVLIACCGEYWSWKAATRPIDTLSDSDILPPLLTNPDATDSGGHTGGPRPSNPHPKVKPERKPEKAKFFHYMDLGPHSMEYERADVNDAAPTDDEWTLNILFGSAASAQHFYLILQMQLSEQEGWEDQPVDVRLLWLYIFIYLFFSRLILILIWIWMKTSRI
ncbi:hypothetical protein BYT27DRAFT_7166729 [Phlegmacium glaucopus]|nr:hypothetical protein BYT27DRAFT_7166729 [Phlegmacium glaucopus]